MRMLLALLFFCALPSCENTHIPRPYGYFRVLLPERDYRKLDTLELPYKFDVSTVARIVSRNAEDAEYWIDIEYPSLNGSVYCSYIPVKGDLFELSEESRRLVYKHTVRAESIGESFYENPRQRVYTLFYDLEGNTASPLQFVVTDSLRHFFRAALYFDHLPNSDSIAPMLHYIREDMIRLIESFEWSR
jgi:gliding motility-associated lipoprotein GldD